MTTTVRFDPHVHSEASYDGSDPVNLVLEHAADIGLDAVAVTDHNVIDASLRAAERAPEYGLVGVPGVEVSTAEGHLLALGVEELPPLRASIAETAAWVRDRGGVSIVPHPFQRSRHGVRKRSLDAADHRGADRRPVDAVEVYNSWLFTGYKNRRARRYAAARSYPGVAGSDAHAVPFVGRAYTELVVGGAVDADAILAAIRDGSLTVRGRRTPIPVSARHYAVGAGKKSGYYAKLSALKGGYYAKAGALRSAKTLLRLAASVR